MLVLVDRANPTGKKIDQFELLDLLAQNTWVSEVTAEATIQKLAHVIGVEDSPTATKVLFRKTDYQLKEGDILVGATVFNDTLELYLL